MNRAGMAGWTGCSKGCARQAQLQAQSPLLAAPRGWQAAAGHNSVLAVFERQLSTAAGIVNDYASWEGILRHGSCCGTVSRGPTQRQREAALLLSQLVGLIVLDLDAQLCAGQRQRRSRNGGHTVPPIWCEQAHAVSPLCQLAGCKAGIAAGSRVVRALGKGVQGWQGHCWCRPCCR